MDILLLILSLCITAIVVLVIGIVAFSVLDTQKQKRNDADRKACRRWSYREIELFHIGEQIYKEILAERYKRNKKKPIRKVYGDFAYMADLWKYEE